MANQSTISELSWQEHSGTFEGHKSTSPHFGDKMAFSTARLGISEAFHSVASQIHLRHQPSTQPCDTPVGRGTAST